MKKRIVSFMLCLVVTCTALSGCGSDDSTSGSDRSNNGDTVAEVSDDDLNYTYGADTTFYSEEPVSYSIMFSDHENYPYKEDWLLWSAIEELTNVTFDITLVGRTDYNDKVSALVNSGDAPYIIPKTYDDSPYVASGQVVAISDWVQYMPNYMKAVEEWDMENDLNEIVRSDGKYYRLPGMWEQAAGGYSLMIRKDIFEAAGIDVEEFEKTATWEDWYEAFKIVKEYTGADYVWSDQYQGGSTMNLAANVYNVRGGYSTDGGDWGLQSMVRFDWDNMEFVFTDTTDQYKEYLSYFNKLYTEGIFDPETFTQDSDTAFAKFYRGESYVINCNYQIMSDTMSTGKMQVDDYELYMIVPPSGPAGDLQISSSRLENGIMISQNALDELGEEEFIKMLRFIDWLWYSDEGLTLTQWGVEGETYTRDSDGTIVLNEDIYYNGINPDAEKKLNVDYGFAGGVFAYGGSTELRFSKFTEGEMDWNERVYEYKTPMKIDPPIMADELEQEDIDLVKTPLKDYISASALQFITGTKSLETDWDTYIAECESKGSQRYEDMINEVFNNTKDLLSLE